MITRSRVTRIQLVVGSSPTRPTTGTPSWMGFPLHAGAPMPRTHGRVRRSTRDTSTRAANERQARSDTHGHSNPSFGAGASSGPVHVEPVERLRPDERRQPVGVAPSDPSRRRSTPSSPTEARSERLRRSGVRAVRSVGSGTMRTVTTLASASHADRRGHRRRRCARTGACVVIWRSHGVARQPRLAGDRPCSRCGFRGNLRTHDPLGSWHRMAAEPRRRPIAPAPPERWGHDHRS